MQKCPAVPFRQILRCGKRACFVRGLLLGSVCISPSIRFHHRLHDQFPGNFQKTNAFQSDLPSSNIYGTRSKMDIYLKTNVFIVSEKLASGCRSAIPKIASMRPHTLKRNVYPNPKPESVFNMGRKRIRSKVVFRCCVCLGVVRNAFV